MNNKKNRRYKDNGEKYWCICPSCSSVGSELIIQQYTNFKNILLEDNSSQIYNLFGRELVK